MGFQSCSSISEGDCKTGDWSGIGLRDGSEGKKLSVFQKYAKDCAQYEVVPNLVQYKSGRHEGLKNFCRQAAFTLAENGQTATGNNMCLQSAHQASYRAGYASGLKAFCTFEKAASYGQTGADLNINICPTSTRSQVSKGYKSGINKYCKEENIFESAIAKNETPIHNCPRRSRVRARNALRDATEYLGYQKDIKNKKDKIQKANNSILRGSLSANETIMYGKQKAKHEVKVKSIRRSMDRIKERYRQY